MRPMLFLPGTLAMLILGFTPAAGGTTVGHWRFENAPGFLADSGSNGLTLSPLGAAPASYALPVSGPGATFNRTIPQTGTTNTRAADLGTLGGGNFLRADSPVFTVTNFTIEAYVHREADTVGTAYIASQYDFSNGALRSWGLGVAGTSPPSGLAAGELFFNVSGSGASATVLGSGLTVAVGADYFVAASFEATNAAGGAVFYVKNFSAAGELTSSVRANPVGGVFDTTADFLIGAYNGGGNRWPGLVDEVRLSNVALGSHQLLVVNSNTLPTVARPGFTPAAGQYSDPVTVSLSCATPAAAIYFTTNGFAPTTNSWLYSAPFVLSNTATVSARAFTAGMTESEVATATYTIASFPLVGKVQPRHASTISNSNWSVGCETVDRDYTQFTNYQAWLGPLGIKRARMQCGWFKCEKVVGLYDWAWLDDCVNGALAQGVQPWLECNYGNPIYPGGGGSGLGAGLPTSTNALAAWDNWVAALVDRYKDRVNEWEVWNEPDNSGGSVTADAYAVFYIRTAEIIRAHQPEAKLYALAVTGPSSGVNSYVGKFFNVLQSSNKLHLVTAVTAHAYPYNPDSSQAGFITMRNWIHTNYTNSIQVRQGESGAPSQFQASFALANISWTELMQTKWDLRRLLGDLGHDIPSSIFAMIDMYYYGTAWNYKGLLKANTNLTVAYPKQAYFGVQNLAAIFDDSLTRITNFSYTANPAATMRVFGYRKDATGKTVATIWFSSSPSGLPADVNTFSPVNFTFAPADFTEPVWVDVRTGEVRAIPATNWSQTGNTCSFTYIPVYDSPILIAERSAIPIATPKQEWKRVHFTVPEQYEQAVSGDEVDPDADGVSNLREYLFSGNPRVSDNTGLPHSEILNDHLTLRYNANQSATDYALVVAGSTNLATWNTNTSVVEQTVGTNSGLVQTRDARLVTPVSAGRQGFLNLYAVPQSNSP